MKPSDLLAVPIQAGAAVRHRRFFHPCGVLARGTLERLAAPGDGLPVESGDVMGRISKGLGTPAGLPDFAGLAWRMRPAPFAATPWDVLLVSAGVGRSSLITNRVLLRPVTSWASADFSSLMPLDHGGALWWIRAHLAGAPAHGGLSLKAIREHIVHGGLHFTIEQACGTGEFTLLARLSLTELMSGPQESDHDIAFDPVRHSAPGVIVWPQWLRDVREVAYRSSREGRDAG